MIPVGDYKLDPPDYEEVEEPAELLTCPFCGLIPDINWNYDHWAIGCCNVDCWMFQTDWVDVQLWNTRKENK